MQLVAGLVQSPLYWAVFLVKSKRWGDRKERIPLLRRLVVPHELKLRLSYPAIQEILLAASQIHARILSIATQPRTVGELGQPLIASR
jgi:hypothetical protein